MAGKIQASSTELATSAVPQTESGAGLLSGGLLSGGLLSGEGRK